MEQPDEELIVAIILHQKRKLILKGMASFPDIWEDSIVVTDANDNNVNKPLLRIHSRLAENSSYVLDLHGKKILLSEGGLFHFRYPMHLSWFNQTEFGKITSAYIELANGEDPPRFFWRICKAEDVVNAQVEIIRQEETAKKKSKTLAKVKVVFGSVEIKYSEEVVNSNWKLLFLMAALKLFSSYFCMREYSLMPVIRMNNLTLNINNVEGLSKPFVNNLMLRASCQTSANQHTFVDVISMVTGAIVLVIEYTPLSTYVIRNRVGELLAFCVKDEKYRKVDVVVNGLRAGHFLYHVESEFYWSVEVDSGPILIDLLTDNDNLNTPFKFTEGEEVEWQTKAHTVMSLNEGAVGEIYPDKSNIVIEISPSINYQPRLFILAKAAFLVQEDYKLMEEALPSLPSYPFNYI